jgi:GNAT superfamily N-acetyltransferase
MSNAAKHSDGDGAAGAPADFSIRPAGPDDAQTIATLVRELAVFVKHEHQARATPDDFREHLFGPAPVAQAALAESGNQAVGFALWFPTFSTFRGQPGLYVEDLYVRPEHRGRGIGKALLAAVAAQALERGCGRVEWSVLKWNTAAIGFYRSLGAQLLDEYMTCRFQDDSLASLAGAARENALALSGRKPTDE